MAGCLTRPKPQTAHRIATCLAFLLSVLPLTLWALTHTLTMTAPFSLLTIPLHQIIFHVGVHCRRPPLPDDCPPPLASLIQRCWQDDPAARPAFTEVLHLLQVRGPFQPGTVSGCKYLRVHRAPQGDKAPRFLSV